MAFSQVETVSSLGIDSVLRDRNRQDVCFKVLVKDHVRNFTPFESASPDENSQSHRIDSWIETTRSAGHVRSKKESVSSSSPRGSSFRKRENSDPGRPDNLGASSLVQIWEARVNKSNGGNEANQSNKSTVSSSRSSSGISTVENSCPASNPTVEVNKSNGRNAASQSQSTVSSTWKSSGIENSCPAAPGESDPTVQIKSADSSDGRDSVSGSGNGERVKVADIVRTLTTDQKKPNSKGAKELSLLKIQRPPPVSSSPSSSPSDPTVEIKSFSLVCPSPRIRGRQAFSDLLMQMERDRHRELSSLLERHAVSAFPKRGRLRSMLRLRSLQRCVAIQDRQRSNSKAAGQNRLQSESAVSQLRDKFPTNSRKSATELTQCSSPASQPEEDSTVLVPSETEEPKPANSCLDSQETSDSNRKGRIQSTVSSDFVENERKNEEEYDSKDHWRPFFGTSEIMSSVELDSCKNQKVEDQDQETALMNCWEEEFDDQDYYYGEANYDWFSEICRPRSYWEDLRKFRYLEVISTRSENEEICRLLERRTVSEFLESEMREKIDRLMASRAETQFGHVGNQEQHPDPWEIVKEEEEEDKIEVEEDQKQENGNSCSDDNSSQSSSQTFLPSPGRSWSSRDPEIRSTHPLPIKNPSSEMELLNNLRDQMELLQGEILELRKSVKTCTDMNLQLQQPVNRVNPLQLKCCICNQTPVEALLYRCGHICTCMKCGNELQWNSGKCPICRASILDVVRVFLDPTHHVKTNSSLVHQ